MFWPSSLAVPYPLTPGGVRVSGVVLSLSLLVGMPTGAFVLRRHRPYLLTGWLWYLIMLAPVIGIIQVGSQTRADRYSYLPQIGLYLLLTWAAAELCAGWRHRRVMLGGCSAVILAALIIRARAQTSYWQNSETLWTHTLACTSGNSVAQNNFGDALLQRGDVDEAMAHFQKALQLNPDYPEARNNLGNALLRKGAVNEAIVQLQKALQLKPHYAKAHGNLGNALLQAGRVDEAVIQFQTALQINPDGADDHNNLGNALLEQDRVDEAITQFQKALQLKPSLADAHNNLGNALLKQGKVDEAIAQFQTALKIKPRYAEACYDLGNALFQNGDLDSAILQYEQALQINPDYAKAHNNLGFALLQKGRVDEAITHDQRALQINPDFADAHNNLANALLQKGNVADAIAHYRKALQLKPDFAGAQNNLAWLLATSPQASLRNGNEAVELAQQANQLTGNGNPIILATLAAAYAEAGRLPEAVTTARRALQLAETQSNMALADAIQSQMKFYQAGLPFHSR